MCDHFEDEGWPMLLDANTLKERNETNPIEMNPCHFIFEWRSKYACRHCLKSEVTEIAGACVWNQREITQQPGKECNIYSSIFVDNLLMDPLNSNKDKIKKE